jgi:hypothetical protein
VVSTTICVIVGSCALPNQAESELRSFAESGETHWYSGFVVFHGEFELYRSEQDYLRGNSRCISGAFPLDAQLQVANSFDRRNVKILARVVEWPGTEEILSVNFEGSAIINNCLREYVFFATQIDES